MKKNLFVITLIAVMGLVAPTAKAQWAANAVDVSPLKIGQTVPDVTLENGSGTPGSLYAAIGDKPTLIMFYRGDWCINCIRHFNEEVMPNLPRITTLGYNVMFIGPDSPSFMQTTAEKINASPSMIWGDTAGDLSVAMGVAWQQPERMLERLAEYSEGKNTGFVPVIATFVVGADKKVLFSEVRPDGISSANRIKGNLLMGILENLQ
jgi:peroxiredoxin